MHGVSPFFLLLIAFLSSSLHSSRNLQTATPHGVHWWLSHQRPVRVGLHCQARCDYHPWRQYSLYGLSLLTVEVEAVTISSAGLPQGVTVGAHLSSSSQCNELATKSGMEAQTGLCRWSASTFENSCGCTKMDMPEWREMIEQIDWRQNNPHKWLASPKVWNVEELETLPEGTVRLPCLQTVPLSYPLQFAFRLYKLFHCHTHYSSPSVFTNCSIVIPTTVRLPSLQTVPLSYPLQFAFRLYKLFPLQFAFRLYKLSPLQFAFRLYQLHLLQNQRTKELISARNT